MSGADAAKTSRALLTLADGHFEASRKVTRPNVAGSLWRIMAKATTSFKSSLSDIPVVPTATPAAGEPPSILQCPYTVLRHALLYV